MSSDQLKATTAQVAIQSKRKAEEKQTVPNKIKKTESPQGSPLISSSSPISLSSPQNLKDTFLTPTSVSSPNHLPLTTLTQSPKNDPKIPNDIDPKTLKERNVPAFLNKLYKMFHDSKYEGLTTWNKDGTSFFVLNPEEFSKTVLPKFFKHSNFSSFVRQLNMYGFHKIPHLEQTGNGTEDQGTWEFTNPNFRKGRPELLQLVKRKHPNDAKSNSQIDVNTILNELHTIKQQQSIISGNLKNIEKDNQALWSEMKASRERYMSQQKLTHKILQFLASIYNPQNGRINGGRLIMDSTTREDDLRHVDFSQKLSGEEIKKQLIDLMSSTPEEIPLAMPEKSTTEISEDLAALDKNIDSIQKTLRNYESFDEDIFIDDPYTNDSDQMATIVELNTGDDFGINEPMDPSNQDLFE